MPGKRKANDMSSAEPEEKLSKKAKLKLARERAAAFAKRDKAKVEKAKKGGAPSPKAAPNNDMAVESPSPAKKSPDKKLSLSERKKIAQQNAKEFAARDKANLKAKKAASPSPSNLGAAIDPTQVQAYEQMRQMQQVVQQQQQQLIAQQQMLMQKSPINAAISVDSEDEKEVEEDVPPPPPALMAQVSQQVLLNAKETVIDSEEETEEAEETSPVIPTESSDVPKPEISESDEPVEATKPKSRWLPKLIFLIVVAAAVSAFVMLNVPLPEMTPALPSPPSPDVVPEETPCYFNSDHYEEDESCANDSSGIPCPEGGVCEGGKLIGCDNSYQAVSERGDKCVLAEDYIPMKIVLMDQLVHHSSKICDLSSKPSFKYTMLQKSQPDILAEESEELIEALIDEGFVVYERDGLYVGLPEDFKVNLPLYCTLGNIGQWLLQEVGLLLLGVLRFAATNFIGFVSAYPKPSAVIFVLYILFSKIRRYRANKKKLAEDIIQTRRIAYKTLEESSGVEHCATHIRDEIAMALYPDSKKLRLELQKKVWPKIVDDVKRDTRVRKFQTLNRDGKTRDMWQWTAASKKA